MTGVFVELIRVGMLHYKIFQGVTKKVGKSHTKGKRYPFFLSNILLKWSLHLTNKLKLQIFLIFSSLVTDFCYVENFYVRECDRERKLGENSSE